MKSKFDRLVKMVEDDTVLNEGISRHLKAIGRTAINPLAYAKGAAAISKGAGSVLGALGAPTLQKIANAPSSAVNKIESGVKTAKKWIRNPDYLKDKEKWWDSDVATMDSTNKLPAKRDTIEAINSKSESMKFSVIAKGKSGKNITYKLKPIGRNPANIVGIMLFVTDNDRGRFITRTFYRGKSNPVINSNAYLEPAGIKNSWLLRL